MKVGDKVRFSSKYKQYACRKMNGFYLGAQPQRIVESIRDANWIRLTTLRLMNNIGEITGIEPPWSSYHNRIWVKFVSLSASKYSTKYLFDDFDLEVIPQ